MAFFWLSLPDEDCDGGQAERWELTPAPHQTLVAAIFVAEFPFEISLLPHDYPTRSKPEAIPMNALGNVCRHGARWRDRGAVRVALKSAMLVKIGAKVDIPADSSLRPTRSCDPDRGRDRNPGACRPALSQ